MKKKHIIITACALSLCGCTGRIDSSAYLEHYKSIIKELSSEKYQGRGYAADGILRAGEFIYEEFRKAGADEVVKQPFSIDVNTFPGKMEASVDGKPLVAGVDFVMREYSPGVKGAFKLYRIDTLNYDSSRIFADLEKSENRGALVVCDFWYCYKHRDDIKRLQSKECPNGGLLQTWGTPLKFYKAYAEKVVDKPIVWTTEKAIEGASQITLDVENKFLSGYESDNIIACVMGERHDSCYVFTAHYDHLGNLGADIFYPGANDNASGTAAIITLAEYYSHNRPEFDIWFVAFSGEDTNLRGSTWFAEHPSMPLESVRYLINLDMIGDNNPVQYCEFSDEGASAFPILERINEEGSYFQSLNRGELAANSDHYPFAVRGVPCAFFENKEGDAFKWYHTHEDNWENAVFDSYLPIFGLVTDFISHY